MSDTYLFDQMQSLDLNQVLAIEVKSFKNPWSKKSFANELLNKDSFNYVVLKSYQDLCYTRSVIAYICFQIIINEMNVLKIAVAPSSRLKGIGTWLIDKSIAVALEHGAISAFLETQVSNYSAIKLYKKFGFNIIGRRTDYYYYYENGKEDALNFMKILRTA